MSLITSAWSSIYERFQKDAFYMDVIGSNCLTIGLFWVVGGLLMFVDLTGRPKWMKRYKTQPGRNDPVDHDKLVDAIIVGLKNQFIIGLPITVVLYYIKVHLGFSYSPDDLPSPLTVIAHLLAFIIFEEIGFYYSHRLFHWGPLYKSIHKKHHEWTAPIGVIAIYAHPIEHILANILPFILGPIVMRAHLLTTWIWYTLAILTTVIHHSGYHLPFMPSPEFHDFHHLKFSCNYGVTGWLDWLHETDKQFRNTVYHKRDKAMFTLKPASLTFPSPSPTPATAAVYHDAKITS